MNTESNLGMAWPLTISNYTEHKHILGLQRMGLGSTHESGESEFWKMISCLMSEQCLHESAALEKEPLFKASCDVTEDYSEENIIGDILTNLMFKDRHFAYDLNNAGHRLEEATQKQVSIQVPSAVFFKDEGEQTDRIVTENGQSKLASTNIDMALNPIDIQDIQMVEEKTGIEKSEAESLIPKEEAKTYRLEEAKLHQSEPHNVNPLQGISSTDVAAELPQAQATGKAEPYKQISEMILSKLEQKGPTEFKMLLEPETLGEIDIKLKLDKGRLTIDILAANTKTQALLTLQVDKLIASMGLRNAQVESIQINQQAPQLQEEQDRSHNMDSAMDTFHKKHQEEQRQRSFSHTGKQGGTVDQIRTQEPDNKTINLIGANPYGSYRINYMI